MASVTILSDNGATSGSAGLKTSGGNDGVLILQTTTSGGTATNAVTIDTNQNVGVGISSIPNYNSNLRTVSFNNTSGVVHDYCVNGTRTGSLVCQSSGFDLTTQTAIPLIFSTNATERMRIDTSGNLGLGVTPSAWDTTNGKAIQLPAGSMWNYTTIQMNLGFNYFWNGTNYKYKNNGYASSFDQSGGAFYWQQAASGTAGNNATFTQAMTLDASGNLGLGVTPSAWLTSYSNKAMQIGPVGAIYGNTVSSSNQQMAVANNLYLDSSANTRYITSDTASRYIQYAGQHRWDICASGTAGGLASLTQAMTLDSSGNLLVGTTTASSESGSGFKFLNDWEGSGTDRTAIVAAGSTNNLIPFTIYSTGAGAYRFYVGLGGTVYATNTTISAISDIRFKENVRDLNVGLAEILALKPRLYDWKEGKGADIKNARGFIAQEFEEVFPDLIDEWLDSAPEGEDPYKSVRQDLIPVLVKAIQEQQAIITQLQADVAALKGQA